MFLTWIKYVKNILNKNLINEHKANLTIIIGELLPTIYILYTFK